MDGVTASISSQARHGALSMSRLLSACSGIETCRILGSRFGGVEEWKGQSRSRTYGEVLQGFPTTSQITERGPDLKMDEG